MPNDDPTDAAAVARAIAEHIRSHYRWSMEPSGVASIIHQHLQPILSQRDAAVREADTLRAAWAECVEAADAAEWNDESAPLLTIVNRHRALARADPGAENKA